MALYFRLLPLCMMLPMALSFSVPSHVIDSKFSSSLGFGQGGDFPFRSQLSAKGKWDSLIDEDDEDGLEFSGGPPVTRDMKYSLFNIKRQRDNFDSIRAVGGKDLTNDVYARDPDTDTFWFIGKVARVSDVPIEKAISRQWPMIAEHAARLRPQELYPKWGKLQLWVAPGDSELDVAYNRPFIRFEKMDRDVDESDKVKNVEIGFQGEMYESGEEGFRTWRTEDGLAAKPEIQSTAENRQPTEAEMDDMMEMLNSQVIPEE